VLVFVDGAAPGNGQKGARAGFGVVYNPLYSNGIIRALELSSEYEPTSNRAELRAAIAALEMRFWKGEGFHRLAIATDSEYVIKGVTEWSVKWKKNGWKTTNGGIVKNQDLWKMLLEMIEKNERAGFAVQFFQLKREWNEAADACARKGAVSSTHYIRDLFSTAFFLYTVIGKLIPSILKLMDPPTKYEEVTVLELVVI
jgi:ribonuclease HI